MAEKAFQLPSGVTGGRPQKFAAREYTTEQQKELLKGYVALPASSWPDLGQGDHIRYFLADGKFRYGGFVLMPVFEGVSKGSVTKKPMVKLGLDPSGSKASWTVPLDNLSQIYLRPPLALRAFQDSVEQALQTMTGNINKIAEAVKKLQRQ